MEKRRNRRPVDPIRPSQTSPLGPAHPLGTSPDRCCALAPLGACRCRGMETRSALLSGTRTLPAALNGRKGISVLPDARGRLSNLEYEYGLSQKPRADDPASTGDHRCCRAATRETWNAQ